MLCLKICLCTKKTQLSPVITRRHRRLSVLRLKACGLVGHGWEQDRRVCVLIDQQGTKLAVSFSTSSLPHSPPLSPLFMRLLQLKNKDEASAMPKQEGKALEVGNGWRAEHGFHSLACCVLGLY